MTVSEITTKQDVNFLLDKIVDDPLHFTNEDFEKLVGADSTLILSDLRHYVCRIFDINEQILKEESVADIPLNRWSQRKRVKRFYSAMRNGFDRHQDKNKIIVAEGDSWFEFPFFIDDIIDHLNDDPAYKIYSLAYGGDWITNIIYEGKYVESLSVLNPDVFLVSGGGNDLVGSDRLGLMVGWQGKCETHYKSVEALDERVNEIYGGDPNAQLAPGDRELFFEVQNYVQRAFYSFIWIMKLQYVLMFRNIHKKHKTLKIITQGYDYAIPNPEYHGWWFSWRYWVNRFLQTGRWLYVPLVINGIHEPRLQAGIVRYMIFEFNLMFASIAQRQDYVYHIDCRGVAQGQEDWYDELHLVSGKFRKVAEAYRECIEFDSSLEQGRKVYFAKG